MDLKDIQRHLDKVMHERNNQALPDFEGYSPYEMHLIIDFPFTLNCPIQMQRLEDADLKKIPMLNQIRYLAGIIAEKGELKLTGKGFLGFKGLTTKNYNTGTVISSLSEIDLDHVFMKPVSTLTTTLDGTSLASTSFTYGFANIDQAPTGVMFPYIATTNSIDKYSGAKTVIEIGYDQYANQTFSMKSAFQTASSTNPIETQNITFSNYINAGGWCPSKPLDQTITSTRQGEPPFTTHKHYTYTTNGNTETITDFYHQDSALVTTYSDYHAGLPKRVRMHVAAHSNNAFDRVVNSTYDSKYRFVESVTDAMGYTTSAKFDGGFGKKLEVTDANGLKSYMKYDGFGSLIETSNHLGVWAKSSYVWKKTDDNVLYYLETISNNSPSIQEYYDLLGRTHYVYSENPDGKMVCIKTEYDQKGRVISVSEPYFKDTQPSLFTSTQYDNYNRPWKITLPTSEVITQTLPNPGSNSYTVSSHNSGTSITKTTIFDAGGKIISATDPGGTLEYTYYSHGNAKSITAPDGSITTMEYDEYGRQTNISDPDAGTLTYTYNAFGEIIGQTDANLNSFKIGYDKAGRLLYKKCTRSGYNTNLINTWNAADSPIGSRGLI